jgi:two-component system phosphate regulon sensor histidine kinase PhoR
MVIVENLTSYRRTERARTDFVANVSHELRTPIATIMGYAETLLDDAQHLDPEVAAQVEVIRRNGQRLRDLFEDLLVLSRIEARSGDLPLTLQRLEPLLEEAVLPAAEIAVARGVEFSLECDPELAARVNAEALGPMVGNLASNASKYTPAGGHVCVVARQVDDGVLVEVHDDGVGIDPIHHDRIFERFYRVDEGRSREVGGTGLGLAIVKHLARATGCSLSMESAVGQGSVFRVLIPGEERPWA